jgi:long-chain acyl-CoA synthetase
MDGLSDAVKKVWANSKVNVVSIEDMEKEGASSVAPRVKTTKDSIATVCFTSGTTGMPKGALLRVNMGLSGAQT